MEINENKQKQLYELAMATIKTSLDMDNIALEDAVCAPGAKKGEAFWGKILQLIVLGKDGGMQIHLHLIIKFSVEYYLKQKLPIDQAYQREIFMYKKVWPAFMSVQRKISNKFVGYPQYFAFNLSATPEHIVLSDLKYEGYKSVDRTEPLNLAHMKVAIKAYAQLHALSFAVRAKDNNQFIEWETKLKESFYSSIEDPEINFIKTHCDKALQKLQFETDRDVIQKFFDMHKTIFEDMKAATISEEAKNFMVVCHGDCSITNLMFRYESSDNQIPKDVAFVDFQLVKMGSPALDLSHLLFMCTDKKLRDEHYQKLLEMYHEELVEFGRKLDVEIDVSFDVLLDHMRKFSIYGLYMAITNLHDKIRSDNDISAVEEIRGVGDAKSKLAFPCFKNEAYAERIRDILIDFHNYDYIV